MAKGNPTGYQSDGVEAKAGGPFAHSQSTGDVDLMVLSGDSSNPRFEVYLAGWAAGYESRQAHVDRITWQRDAFYFVMANPGKKLSDFYSASTSALWDEAVTS